MSAGRREEFILREGDSPVVSQLSLALMAHFINSTKEKTVQQFKDWRKSTRSGTGDMCVEVSFAGDAIGVRDSKDQSGPVLSFTKDEWAAFVAGVKDDEFNS